MWIFVIELLLDGSNCIFRPEIDENNVFISLTLIFTRATWCWHEEDLLRISLADEIADLQDGFPVCLQQELTGGFVCKT